MTKILPADHRRHEPHPHLARSYVEAQLIAVATIRPDVAAAVSRRAWRSQLSPDALTFLDAIVYGPSAAWCCPSLLAENDVQLQLVWDAQHMTRADLTAHSVGTLLALARGPLRECMRSREAAA